MGKILLWVIVIIVALLVMRVVASRAAARNSVPRAKPDASGRSAGGAGRADKAGWFGKAGRSGGAGNAGDSGNGSGSGNTGRPTRGAPDPTLGASEPMVRCAHCGIHLPRSEALMKDGKTWCSDAHAQLGVRQV